jgi:AAA+ superfamily predicted ATPase
VSGRAATRPRLTLDLEVLRIATGAYLDCLRAVWAHPEHDDHPGGDEVQRIALSVGARPRPGAKAVARVRALLEQTPAAGDPLGRMATRLDLSRGEELLVAAAWWAQADPQFAMLLGCAHDDGARRFASAALLRLVLEPFAAAVAPPPDDGSALVRHGVVEPGAGAGEALELTATARLLLGGGAPEQFAAPTPALARMDEHRDALARWLAGPDADGVVLLRGPAGVGRRDVAVQAAHAAGLVPIAGDRPPPELKLLTRLRVSLPVVPAADLEALDWGAGDGAIVAYGPPAQPAAGAYVVDLRAPDHAERERLWREAVDPDLAGRLATRFTFTEGQIAEALERARLDAALSERELDGDFVWAAARRQGEHALGHLAALVTPAFTLDDLVLDEETDSKLRELVSHVALQHVVLDAWGFRRRLPRGQGVAALFSGPPGTGKTTAAEAIARELDQDLYRIDLSAVVSKYVGETEKNLAAAFDEAERGSAVLFFDEADALFGKRTEVRDAHDRYANLEVAYLLQRVETFTGLVLLATNRQAAIDEAFLRRLRFVVRFEAPDAALRRRLWERSFPAEARLGALDFEALASAELTGGNIQASALAAAYLAAANGGVITREHVEHALAREYDKLGRAWAGLRAGAAP